MHRLYGPQSVGFGEELTNAQPLDMTRSFLGSRGLWILRVLRGCSGRSLRILEANTVPWKILSVQTVSKMKLGGDWTRPQWLSTDLLSRVFRDLETKKASLMTSVFLYISRVAIYHIVIILIERTQRSCWEQLGCWYIPLHLWLQFSSKCARSITQRLRTPLVLFRLFLDMRFPTSIKFQRSFLIALVMAPLSHCTFQDELQLCLRRQA